MGARLLLRVAGDLGRVSGRGMRPSSVGLWVVVGTITMHSFNEMVVFTC